MKTVVKQKRQTLQEIINNAQSGGGDEPVDAYTKAEADAKFQTIEGMTNYVPVTGNYMTVNGIRIYVSATAPTGEIPVGSIGIGW